LIPADAAHETPRRTGSLVTLLLIVAKFRRARGLSNILVREGGG
jgi:hypothetical protein